jgi:phage terminase small subunit
MSRPGKPSGLIERHETAAERAERFRRESSMRPNRDLPQSPPAQLKNHKVAQAAWRYLLRRWSELEAEIVTSLDIHLIVNYCLAVEQQHQLGIMRESAYQTWLEISREHDQLVNDGLAKDAVAMAIKTTGAFEAIIKLDSRIDRKVDLIHKLSQSLYLTPRARASKAPKAKPIEEPPDEMDLLLDGQLGEVSNGN